MLAGWGIFNLVEGVIDHQLLGLHNVHEGSNELAWDLAFLVSGVTLIFGGWLLARRERATELEDCGGGWPGRARSLP